MSARRSLRRNESGFYTIWVIGMCMCLFMIGGISIDLWRVLSDHREVQAIADGAATAAASQIDIAHFQATSEVTLDPTLVGNRVNVYIAQQEAKASSDIQIENGKTKITMSNNNKVVDVQITYQSHLTLMKFLDPTDPGILEFTTEATASPQPVG